MIKMFVMCHRVLTVNSFNSVSVKLVNLWAHLNLNQWGRMKEKKCEIIRCLTVQWQLNSWTLWIILKTQILPDNFYRMLCFIDKTRFSFQIFWAMSKSDGSVSSSSASTSKNSISVNKLSRGILGNQNDLFIEIDPFSEEEEEEN